MIGVVTYRLVLLAIALFPDSLAYRLARGFGYVRYRRLRHRRERQRRNLETVLGLAPTAAERLFRRTFEVEVLDHLEAAFFHLRPKERIKELVEIRGLDRLDAALSLGKGAILYSGHSSGNYTLFAGLGLRGYPARLVRIRASPSLSRLQRWFHDRFSDSVRDFGCPALWYEPGAGRSAGVAAALARNEIVIILIDLSMSQRNLPVRFFGDLTEFPAGPVTLAQRTGAPLLDFCVHRPDAGFPLVAEVGQPFDPSPNVVDSVQACVSRLEANIRRHPADWAAWHIFGPRPEGPADRSRGSVIEGSSEWAT